jgi:hypothetical protein
VYGLIERGAEQRATGTTKLNELSSRSHAVFIIIIEKSTVQADAREANDEEMEQFRGLAPGAPPIIRHQRPLQRMFRSACIFLLEQTSWECRSLLHAQPALLDDWE